METTNYILVMNGGSSSLKFSIFDYNDMISIGRGAITGIGTSPIMSVKGPIFEGHTNVPDLSEKVRTPGDAARELLLFLESFIPKEGLMAVGHRVLHGRDLMKPTIVRPYLLAYLKTLIPMAPLHQPFNLQVMEMVMSMYPQVPQIACFDTAFHATIPSLHTRFALPRVWHDKGLRRYGFHGLSYEYISSRLPGISPRGVTGKTIVAHLGSGASLCAMDAGKSFSTTMGFTVLDGLVMGTRPGSLDPGVILYFLREAKLNEQSIERMLYHDSGLRGVSGISNDMAVLLASPEPSAREAIDLFCLRITRELGGLTSILGGLDTLVFTGGVGENAATIRAQISDSMHWMGLKINHDTNSNLPKGDVMISTPDSKVDVCVIPTDEESVIARHTKNAVEEEAAPHAVAVVER